MIDSYAVKFYNGQDWITFRVFTHREEELAFQCAKFLQQWRDVQVMSTISKECLYEGREHDMIVKKTLSYWFTPGFFEEESQ